MPKRKAQLADEGAIDDALASGSNDALKDSAATRPNKKARTTNRKTANVKVEVTETAVVERGSTPDPPPTKARTKRVKKCEVKEEPDSVAKSPKGKRSKKVDISIKEENTEHEEKPQIEGKSKSPRKRKTREEKEAESMPLAPRTVGHKLFVGAHVSASGGVHNAVANSIRIGANAFALFLKSQRKWANPALAEDVAENFISGCSQHSYDATKHVVPHGSYLVNLAHTDADRTKQAYEAFLDDLQRCERLCIKLYNFHPGNTASMDRAKAIKHLAGSMNRAHRETKSVITLLENMAAGGNIIGTTFEDLRDIISHIEDKSRVGVCLDTCHAFAAGYDLRTPEAFKKTLESFDTIVGLKYLKALHINDSKAPFESKRDLHANIGTGFLGLRAFHNVVNEPHFVGLPLVLETPTNVTDDDGEPIKDEKGNQKEDANTWAKEIKLLESMVGMDTESKEFLELESSLARKGAKERERLAGQAERRIIKEAKKAEKASRKSKKSKLEDAENDDVDESENST